MREDPETFREIEEGKITVGIVSPSLRPGIRQVAPERLSV